MKYQKSVNVLIVLIVLLSLLAGIIGILSMGGSGTQTFLSINSEIVHLYGKGIYVNDSVAAAAQAIAQDWVTVFLGVPLLIFSCIFSGKNSLRARILLAGTLAYFLYTYMSYSFLCMYNHLFFVYVALMSMSFFALTLVMVSFDLLELKKAFSEDLPVKTIGILIIIFACAISLMWLGRIVPSLVNGGTPSILEHYTTLVIQVLDLGFVIPVSFLSAILLIRRKPIGLLLSSVMCMKGATMLTSLTGMVINQALAGVKMSIAEIVIFPAANVLVLIGVFAFMTKIKEPDADKAIKQ
ncbi:hypothetical protein acsn021_22910 [Anaerocolumna cellulosilytica]|uniref:Uncharacterized protein n=1 Tax=Anaerocolumna cellulosilytica TaxID=433286 RepID=A0A6S6R5K8_9FIRM|nr:hypothetical protein [Anaerocolumna cellulosilytica]MBB5194064.1 putative neutral ceramidase superfamily lipid hydrolase [Anaerocolumna cellulosilytica]BCJ94722.1 hypothetical protein acsn021_22910 [Anaerocolumna cellulosilytica]